MNAGYDVSYRVRCRPVATNIDTDDKAFRTVRKSFCHCIHSLAGEPKAVNERVLGAKPKESWPRIAELRLRGNGSNLGVTEAEPSESMHSAGVLVEAGCKTQRGGEGEVCDLGS